MRIRWHRWWWLVFASTACSLNPQPELPGAQVSGSGASGGAGDINVGAGGAPSAGNSSGSSNGGSVATSVPGGPEGGAVEAGAGGETEVAGAAGDASVAPQPGPR